jgi:hypothetical protein
VWPPPRHSPSRLLYPVKMCRDGAEANRSAALVGASRRCPDGRRLAALLSRDDPFAPTTAPARAVRDAEPSR